MRKRLGHYAWAVLILGGAVLLFPGCEQKSINHILADPQRYANHEVGVVGRVVRSYSVLGHGAYEVDDGTGTLWVVSRAGVPREGVRVAVKGTIHDGYNLGELGGVLKLPGVLHSGVVMLESGHKAKD